ncbi:MAG TPA: DUF1284 domain-containing protein [Actinobacteria bacterium]|nr:DUF1284 domain-containing protein [Actinomycetota bacterium]
MAIINLRPHHLLCIFGWQGHGYDPAFTDNFNNIVTRLKAGSKINLVIGDDDICGSCPKFKTEDSCFQGEPGGPDPIDDRVISRLGLTPGEVYEFKTLATIISRKLTPMDLPVICGGCQWLPFGWCESGLSAPLSLTTKGP